LNDCWGCTSWSIVDYYLRPKLAWYAIRRELRPITISIQRTIFTKAEYLHWRDRDDPEIKSDDIMWLDIWGVNSALEEVEIEFRLQCYDITTGSKVYELIESKGRIPANGSSQIASFNLSPRAPPDIDPSNTVVSVAFTDTRSVSQATEKPSGMLRSRSAGDWPQPLKYIDFRDRGVKFSVDGEEITVTAKLPTKSVVLDVEGEDDSDLEWSDNGFDVMPGETIKVRAKGLNGRKVTISWYGDSF